MGGPPRRQLRQGPKAAIPFEQPSQRNGDTAIDPHVREGEELHFSVTSVTDKEHPRSSANDSRGRLDGSIHALIRARLTRRVTRGADGRGACQRKRRDRRNRRVDAAVRHHGSEPGVIGSILSSTPTPCTAMLVSGRGIREPSTCVTCTMHLSVARPGAKASGTTS